MGLSSVSSVREYCSSICLPFGLRQTPQVMPSGVFLASSHRRSPSSASQTRHRSCRVRFAIAVIVLRIFRRTSHRFESSLAFHILSARSRALSLPGFFGVKVRFSPFFSPFVLKCSCTHHSFSGFTPNSDFSSVEENSFFLLMTEFLEPVTAESVSEFLCSACSAFSFKIAAI